MPPSTVLSAAFAASFLAVGVPYWLIPYAQVALPGSLVTPGLLVPFLGAAVARGGFGLPFGRSALVPGLAVPSAVLLRVIVGTVADPTSHNLWPLELILAGAVGLGVSLCGALLGSVLRLLRGRGA